MIPEIPAYVFNFVVGLDVVVGLVLLVGIVRIRLRLDSSDTTARFVLLWITILLIAWFAMALWLSKAGVFEVAVDGPIPPMIFYGIWLPVILGALYIVYSKTFARILQAVPQHWLVGFQIYRAAGVIFLILHAKGLLPGVFAIPAGYGDILVGVLAPFAAYYYVKRRSDARQVVFGWNLLGIGDLVVALTLGSLSSPGRFQFLALDAPNHLIGAYPLVMIPVFAVPLSILLHACSLKKLKLGKN